MTYIVVAATASYLQNRSTKKKYNQNNPTNREKEMDRRHFKLKTKLSVKYNKNLWQAIV